ncbi:MAG: hypothetical protein MZV63_02830 [Marinilabiliales bacterium]|nr:hypothetical protein [Marinilabiliales bacterium]
MRHGRLGRESLDGGCIACHRLPGAMTGAIFNYYLSVWLRETVALPHS